MCSVNKPLEPWQDRLLKEYEDLKEKIEKLTKFLEDDKVTSKMEQQYVQLMYNQLHHMHLYSVDLFLRLRHDNLLD